MRRASHFSIFYLTFASLSGQVTSYFCHWAGRQSATEERCDAAISHVVTWRRTCDVECLGRGPLWKSGNIDRCKSLCRVSNCVRGLITEKYHQEKKTKTPRSERRRGNEDCNYEWTRNTLCFELCNSLLDRMYKKGNTSLKTNGQFKGFLYGDS